MDDRNLDCCRKRLEFRRRSPVAPRHGAAGRRRAVLKFAAIAACSFAFGAGVPESAGAECKIGKVAELPVSIVSNQPLLKGEINGQPIEILINTGLQRSTVWYQEAKRLGLPLSNMGGTTYGVGGGTPTLHTTVKELKIGDSNLGETPLWVAGGKGNQVGQASMSLGEDFWLRFSVEFDFPHNMIRLYLVEGCKPEQLVYWAPNFSLAELERPPKQALRLETIVFLNGVRTSAVLDTGLQTSTVSTAAAARANVHTDSPGVVPSAPITGFGRAAVPTWIAKFDTFALGDEQIKNTKLSIGDIYGKSTVILTGTHIDLPVENAGMAIGADFFMSHRVFVPAGELYFVFTYVGGPVFRSLHDSAAPPATAVPNAAAQPETSPK